jgi:hypothetical protein
MCNGQSRSGKCHIKYVFTRLPVRVIQAPKCKERQTIGHRLTSTTLRGLIVPLNNVRPQDLPQQLMPEQIPSVTIANTETNKPGTSPIISKDVTMESQIGCRLSIRSLHLI